MDTPARVASALLARERALLAGIGTLLASVEADPDTRRRVQELAGSLDELFLLVVAGEFNAGKSSLVNALFGRRVMEEGPVPTTDKITVLRHADADDVHRRSDFITERRLPHPLLEHLAIVDTPGTNSIVREHQALTEDFVPRADLVLFVTSYDRPLSESERQFLGYIRGAWRKQLVVVVNKADLAETEEALGQVLAHVRDGLATILGADTPARAPLVFPVAARLALQAREEAGAADVRTDPRWEASRFGPFERFLTETLTAGARVALKLAGPLDAAETLLADARARLDDRAAVLTADDAQLGALRARFATVRTDLDDVTARATAEIDRELYEMEQRGSRFLDDTIRISRVALLRDRNAFREEFARQVVRDAEARIETRLGEAADAILRRVYDLWNETYARLADLRRTASPSGGGFLYDRDAVLRDVLRQARGRIDAYDMGEEARRLLENARSALTVGGATAVGLGAAAVVLIAATAFDITGGILAVGAAATLGLVVLPLQRRRAVREFSERVAALRIDLRGSLEQAFAAESDSAVERVHALLAPIEALVTTQRAVLDADADRLGALHAEATALRSEVRAQFGEPMVQSAPADT
jgi:GTP-binding protein EngB required for normal cell division